MTHRENMLRAIRFETPDYIPMAFAVNGACWQSYPHEAIFELMESHKFLFPNYKRPTEPFTPQFHPISKKDKPFIDDFGCVWTTAVDGFTGTVTKHPLADWNDFNTYKFPEPSICTGLGKMDWDQARKDVKKAKENGHFTSGGLRHGHTFLQLSDLRGYEALTFDFTDDEPNLIKLIEKLEEFNAYIINQYVDMDVDMVSYAEDLGMQFGPMLSPTHFKQYIKPSYQRLMKPARDKGCIVHMHSDGDIRSLVDDLIDGGVEVINLQDLVNGIDWIADKFAGKTCVDLDIDRQAVTVHGTPADIENLIKEEVTKIGSKKGGLTMIHGWYPGAPLENVKALMDAMEKYAFYY